MKILDALRCDGRCGSKCDVCEYKANGGCYGRLLENDAADLIERQSAELDERDARIARMYEKISDMTMQNENKVYVCDPAKNEDCRKETCHIYGGPCRLTTKIEHAQFDEDPVKLLEDIRKVRKHCSYCGGTNCNVCDLREDHEACFNISAKTAEVLERAEKKIRADEVELNERDARIARIRAEIDVLRNEYEARLRAAEKAWDERYE